MEGLGSLVYQIFTDYVAPVLISIIMLLISALLKKLYDKLKIKISDAEHQKIMSVAETLVLSVEEKTAAKIKELKIGDGETAEKVNKLSTVVSALISQFPKLTPEQAEEIALAAVAKLPGVGITQLALPSPQIVVKQDVGGEK